jgi:hypothetical protein
VGAICILAIGVVVYLVLQKRKQGKDNYGPVRTGNTTQEYLTPIDLQKVELDTRFYGERAELGSGNHQPPYSGNAVYHEVHA